MRVNPLVETEPDCALAARWVGRLAFASLSSAAGRAGAVGDVPGVRRGPFS